MLGYLLPLIAQNGRLIQAEENSGRIKIIIMQLKFLIYSIKFSNK